MTTSAERPPAGLSSPTGGTPRSRDYETGYHAGYLAGARLEPGPRRKHARWNPEMGEFEMQCPECRIKGRNSYWPITLEFWHPRTVIRCRACHEERDRNIKRELRKDPARRARDNAAVAAWRERNPGYNTETSRLWRKLNPERKRAQDRARYERRRAA